MTLYDEPHVVRELRAMVEARASLYRVSVDLGVNYSYVHDVLRRGRPPSERLLAALGYERVPPGRLSRANRPLRFRRLRQQALAQ